MIICISNVAYIVEVYYMRRWLQVMHSAAMDSRGPDAPLSLKIRFDAYKS